MNEIKDVRRELVFRSGSVEKRAMNSSDEELSMVGEASTSPRSFSITSYNWCDSFTIDSGMLTTGDIPKMILTEFQPRRGFEWANATAAIAKNIFSRLENIPLAGDLMNAAGNNYIKSTYEQYVLDAYSSGKESVLGTPMDYVKRLFNGQYLNSYEIPFFKNEYLKANEMDGWTAGGSERTLGEETAKLAQENFNLNVPMMPIWSKGGDTGMSFVNEFYLINDTDENLLKNFRFLHSFVSGAFWVQLGYMQQSPNVYDVVVPGRFHMYFAAVGIEVEYAGKMRTNEGIASKISASGFKGIPNGILFPDAYKIEVNVKDLCPNNFNTYLDHLVSGGHGGKPVEIGSIVERVIV